MDHIRGVNAAKKTEKGTKGTPGAYRFYVTSGTSGAYKDWETTWGCRPQANSEDVPVLLQGSEVIVASEVSTTDFTGQLFALKPSYFDDIRVDSMTVLRLEWFEPRICIGSFAPCSEQPSE